MASDTVDTSGEAVEGYAVSLEARGFAAEAATLRALAKERDAAIHGRELVMDMGVFTIEELKKQVNSLEADALAAASREQEARREAEDLKVSVVAFCAPWAVEHAKVHGLPPGHLFPTHYDILAKAGARMDSFTRAALAQVPRHD